MTGADIGFIVVCVVLALWGSALLFARVCGFVLFVFGIGAVVMKVM